MSLDLTKLESVHRFRSGAIQARCPACAADGRDRKGEHLRIYPDGRFGCAAHPSDSEHRRSIFRLAGGKRDPGALPSLGRLGRVKPSRKSFGVLKAGILGRLGRVNFSHAWKRDKIDEKLNDFGEGVRAVREAEASPTSNTPSAPSEPYVTSAGCLVIPFTSDPRFHWWNGGQSILATLAELNGEDIVWRDTRPTTATPRPWGAA